MGVQMNRNLLWLHVDEAGRPLRRYSWVRETLRIFGVIVACMFTIFSLWCFIVLLDLVVA